MLQVGFRIWVRSDELESESVCILVRLVVW